MTEADKQARADADGALMPAAMISMAMKLCLRSVESLSNSWDLPDDPRVTEAKQLITEGKAPIRDYVRILATVFLEQRAAGIKLAPAADALITAVKLEAMLSQSDPLEVWPEDREALVACTALIGLAAGMDAHRAFGFTPDELLSTARSKFGRKGQLAAAAARTDWRIPAAEYLTPVVSRKPGLSNNEVAKELERAPPDIYADSRFRPPDRVQVAKWVGRERKPGGLLPPKPQPR